MENSYLKCMLQDPKNDSKGMGIFTKFSLHFFFIPTVVNSLIFRILIESIKTSYLWVNKIMVVFYVFSMATDIPSFDNYLCLL